MDQPNLVVLGGPNGSGKSTIASRVLQKALFVGEFVNADVIASGLSAFHPENVAIHAGRIMLERLNELASQRQYLQLKQHWQHEVWDHGFGDYRESKATGCISCMSGCVHRI